MTSGEITLHIAWGTAALGAAVLLAWPRRSGATNSALAQGSDARASAPIEPCPGRRTAVVVLIAGAWLAGHAARLGLPEWGESSHQPFWVALVAAAAGFALELFPRPGPLLRGAAVALVTGMFAVIVLVPGVELEWRQSVASQWIGGVAIGIVASGFFFIATAEGGRARGFSWPARLVIAGAAVASLSLLSRYAKFTESSAVLVAALVPATAALAFRRSRALGAGTSLVVAAVLASILSGDFLHTLEQDRVPTLSFILLGAGLLGLGLHGPRACCAPRLRSALRWTALLVLIGGALTFAYFDGNGGDAGDDDWSEYYQELGE